VEGNSVTCIMIAFQIVEGSDVLLREARDQRAADAFLLRSELTSEQSLAPRSRQDSGEIGRLSEAIRINRSLAGRSSRVQSSIARGRSSTYFDLVPRVALRCQCNLQVSCLQNAALWDGAGGDRPLELRGRFADGWHRCL